ncbi:unnamed protein product [Arctia plantaginis]|uniref:Spondin-1 n=1 Tax=Arctia plantaginis TaxID=874455 RepID=A0A8S1BDP4_ARCPL|nr:unnamed protein product [Arctia plantaginis]CAB3256624.1 unnamed protein product [Arctia plantaginis]
MLCGTSVFAAVALWTLTLGEPQCEKAPPHAQPIDSHYRLGLAGEPEFFLSGELYTVTLQGVDSGQGPTPFIGFTIWVEVYSDTAKGENINNQPIEAENTSLGSFQAYDAQAKIHEQCSPAVDNATSHPKTEVQVIWGAPVDTKDLCIRICAKAGPVPLAGGGTSGGWSVLVRELCAAPAASSKFAKLSPIVEPCCACDEAKYEVTFESLWSRNTHPREFPPESARAHFGDVIGASHTAQFRVWQEGRVASTGLRRLVDDGSTTALEKELKSESDHIRTIIKTRGISWQQIGGVGTPNTFAVFRVDAKHHLISLASKLAPSPDWFVGVSALELCNVNCTWSSSATVPLYPYDAGTDNGISYMSRRTPTLPSAPVRALRPDWPRDVRSPFYSSAGEMRPFARLRLTRLRLYEKSCDAAGNTSEGEGADGVPKFHGGATHAGGGGACITESWGPWGPCSVSCGPGRATRQRHYVWPARAYAEACRVALTDYKRCHGPRMHCRAPSEYEPDPAESSGPCAVSAWSQWSPCEGCGVRSRTRHYVADKAYKRCHVGYRARTILSQAMPCDIGPCEKPAGNRTNNATNFDWFFVDITRGDCRVTSWGSWSPCSAKCGRGHRLRTRLYIAQDDKVQREMSRRLLAQWNRRFAQFQAIEYPIENMTHDDTAVESAVQEHMERCQFTLTQQEALCDGEDISCINTTVSHEVCKLPMSVGHCRGYEERWFYEWARGVCEPFGFSGCGGNGNNFRTRDHCLQACRTLVNVTTNNETKLKLNESTQSRLNEFNEKKLKPTPSHQDNEVIQNDIPSLYVEENCEVGPWLGWTACTGDCEFAIKLNYRLILNAVAGEGKDCRRLIKSRPCKPSQCRKINTTDVVQHMNDYED